MNDAPEKVVYIPDTMSDWPWQAKFNPLYDEVEAESVAWLTSFRLHTPESQDAHNKARIGRLAAFVYADAPGGMWQSDMYVASDTPADERLVTADRLRVATDLLHVLYVIDEYTDLEPSAGVREISGIVLDALRNPYKPRSEGELAMGEMIRQ